MSDLGFSVSYKSAKFVLIEEIHDMDIYFISFFLIFHRQNKNINQSECSKSKTFVFVKALKRTV